MTKHTLRKADKAGIVAGAALLALLTGCMAGRSNQREGYRIRPGGQVQASVAIQDDYDYYPSYQVYYNRSRNEYVYRDGFAWVTRPEPRGVTVAVLFASPSVRLDFHDAPSRHHRSVVRTYPKTWTSAKPHDGANDRNIDRRDQPRNDREDNRTHDGRANDRRD